MMIDDRNNLALGLITLAVVVLMVSLLVAFSIEHGRFPVGSGEVLNWLFDLPR